MPAIRDIARASLYRGKINLWVEDEVTRAYLSALWNSPDVAFLVGGGNEGVRAIVNDARESGFRNVFALIDRDFRPTNVDGWLDKRRQISTFVLGVHEIENHLLDAKALSAARLNNLGKSAEQIEAIMMKCASDLCWWAACRQVIGEIRNRFREGFIKDPSTSVSTAEQAIDHIIQSEWFRQLATNCAQTTRTNVLDQTYRAVKLRS